MMKIKNNRRSHKIIIVLVALLLVLAYAGSAFGFKFWPFHKHITITAPSVQNSLPSNTAASSNQPASSSSSGSTSKTVSDNPKAPAQTQADTRTLSSPSGTFVNLYNATADTQMSSICNTVSGASCQVIFTDGNLSIALTAKTADNNGTTSWAWTPQQIGLTKGKWHVTAKATLGSQTKTTDNGSLELVIQ